MLRIYFRLQTRTATVFMKVYCLRNCSTPTTSAFWRTWKPFSAARVEKSRDLAWVIHYLTSESNTTVNFCTPFKTSVNYMKYRERGNGLATHRDRAGSAAPSTWLHIDSAELESVIYRPLLPLYCIVLCGIVWRYCALRDLSTAHKPLHCAFCILGMNNLSEIWPCSGWKKRYYRSNECIVVMIEVYTFLQKLRRLCKFYHW